MWGGRLPPRLCGEAVSRYLRELDDPAEDADVGDTVGGDADRGVVVVVAEARAAEPAVDGLPGTEVESGQVPGINAVLALRLRIRVDQPVGERELRHHGGRALLARPNRLAAALGDVDPGDAGLRDAAVHRRRDPRVAVVVLGDQRVVG